MPQRAMNSISKRLDKNFETEQLLRLRNLGKVEIILLSTAPHLTSNCVQQIIDCTVYAEFDITILPLHHMRSSVLSSVVSKGKSIRIFSSPPGIDRINAALSEIDAPFLLVLYDWIIVAPYWLNQLLWPFIEENDMMITQPFSNVLYDLNFDDRSEIASENELNQRAKERIRHYAGQYLEHLQLQMPCFLCRSTLIQHIGGLDYELRDERIMFIDWLIRAQHQRKQTRICLDTYVHVLHDLTDRSSTDTRMQSISSSSWDLLRRKWHANPDTSLRQLSQQYALDFAIDRFYIDLKSLSPPVVSVIVLPAEYETTNHTRLSYIAEQHYSSIEVIYICQWELISKLPVIPNIPSYVIGYTDSEFQRKSLDKAWGLASGEYILYWNPDRLYPVDHIGRLVQRIHPLRHAAAAASYEEIRQSHSLTDIIHLHPEKLQPRLLPADYHNTVTLQDFSRKDEA